MRERKNFRDLGAIKAADEKVVAKKRLLRSAVLSDLSDEEMESLINEYNIKNVVDFRSAQETKQTPYTLPEDIVYTHIDLLKFDMEHVPSEDHLKELNDPSEVHGMMMKIYEILLESNDAQNGYRQFIDILLSEKKGSTLFHCSAGKDRTGIAAAIILALLGVDEASIMQDFLITNTLRAQVNESIIEEARLKGCRQIELDGMRIAFSVDESYLRHVFELSKSKDDSFYDHLVKIYNLSDSEIAELRSSYLE